LAGPEDTASSDANSPPAGDAGGPIRRFAHNKFFSFLHGCFFILNIK
jgi:hypothetical protein